MNVGSMNIGQTLHRTLSGSRPVEALYLSKDTLPAVEKRWLRCFDASLGDLEEFGFHEVSLRSAAIRMAISKDPI